MPKGGGIPSNSRWSGGGPAFLGGDFLKRSNRWIQHRGPKKYPRINSFLKRFFLNPGFMI